LFSEAFNCIISLKEKGGKMSFRKNIDFQSGTSGSHL
jgi:hypothetical protein